ncbi:MAG: glutathione S-transferase family protein, partial [Candidatus Puniceispirillum sp.]
LAAAAHLSVLDFFGDIDWSRHAEAKLWFAKMKSRPSFRDLLGDQVVGMTPPPHYSDMDF